METLRKSGKIRVGRMFEIPINSLDPDELRMRKAELIVRSTVDGSKYGFAGKGESVRLYEEGFGVLRVPRRYGFERIGGWEEESVEDDRTTGGEVEFVFRKSLRPDQEEPVRKMLHELRTVPWGGGILRSPCGSGKTVMILKVLAELKLPALVVVHKEFLVDQWRERIKEFLGIDEIGLIQQNVCDFRKPIVIGMIQSLADRVPPTDREDAYPEEVTRRFGVVVFDECHRVAAPFFSKAVSKFWAKYRIGASATPRRMDGLDDVFLWHIGRVVEGVLKWELKPKVYQLFYPLQVPSWEYRRGGGKISHGVLINKIAEDEGRNLLLVGELVKAVKAGRKVLMLSDRLDHLKTLRIMFRQRMPEVKTGYYVGGMKEEDRRESAKTDVLFGTYQFAKEGVDVPDLDTLFLATPHVDVEQPVGRILRRCEDKKSPLVLDVVDGLPVTLAFGAKRKRFYESQGFEVRQVGG